MKKLSPLFMLCLLLVAGSVSAQRQARAILGSPVHMDASLMLERQAQYELGTMTGPAAAVYGPTPATATGIGTVATGAQLRTTSLNATLLSTSTNAFTIISNRQHQIATSNSHDLISFIHRQDVSIHPPAGVVQNGVYRVTYSTNNGVTWLKDRGPLNPTPYPHNGRARYPQLALTNRTATNVDDVVFGFAGPLTDGTNWGNYNYGLFNDLTALAAGTTQTLPPSVCFRFLSQTGNNQQVFIPGSLVEGMNGEFWFSDMSYDPPANLKTGQLNIFKGLSSQFPGACQYTLDTSFDLLSVFEVECGTGTPANPINPGETRANTLTDVMAFDPSGMYGYVAISGDVKDPGSTGYDAESDIAVWSTSDGGATWGTTPSIIKLRNFKSVVDSIFTQFTSGEVSTGIPTITSIDIAVDVNGNPHIFGQVVNSSAIDDCDSLDFVSPGAFKVMVDFFSPDRGATWCAKHIAFANTWRGTAPQSDLTFGVHEHVVRSDDGTKIFFFWLDDTSATEPSAMEPDLWGRGLDVATEGMTAVKNFSASDLTYANSVFFPQVAHEVISDGPNFEYQAPVVFANLPGGAEQTINLFYAANVGFNNNEFLAPAIDLAVSAIPSPAAALCAGTTTATVTVQVSNVGAQLPAQYSVILDVQGPINTQDTLVMTGTPTAVNFPNINFSASGTYLITATVLANGDNVCENNIVTKTVVSVGGAGNQIWAAAADTGCGSLLLNPNLAGGTYAWTPGGETTPTLLVTTNGTYGVTVSVPGCAPITDNLDVTIFPQPVLTAGNVDACATAAPSVVTAGPASGMSYNWNVVSKLPTTIPNALVANNTGTFSGQGRWVYEIVGTDITTGCVADTQITVTRWAVDANLAGLDTTQCDGPSLSGLTGSNPAGTVFTWLVDGDTASTSAVQPLLKGEYAYTLMVADPIGCGSDMASISIENSDSTQFRVGDLITLFGDVQTGTAPINFDESNTVGTSASVNCRILYRADTVNRAPVGLDPLTPYTLVQWRLFPRSNIDQAALITSPGAAVNLNGPGGSIIVDNADFVIVDWLAQGTGVVTFTLESGACQTVVTKNINLSNTPCPDTNFVVSINETSNIANFSVFPNPSSGRFNLNLELNHADNVEISVMDVTGRVVAIVKPGHVQAVAELVDMSAQPAGLYLISVRTSQGVQTLRVVKQ